MSSIAKVSIGIKSYRLLQKLLKEVPRLKDILDKSHSNQHFIDLLKAWVMEEMEQHPFAMQYYKNEKKGRKAFDKLSWRDFACIRILDYIDHSGKKYEDLNLKGKLIINEPFKHIRDAYKYGKGGANFDFFVDMFYLFKQFTGSKNPILPTKNDLINWMNRFPSGCDKRVVHNRFKNKERIIKIIADKISKGIIKSSKYYFDEGTDEATKIEKINQWWETYQFHLRFAIKDPETLNEMLDYSLNNDIMKTLYDAQKAGIPFFINPYYLTLLDVRINDFCIGADMAIRDYIIYSKNLIEEFGNIVAWEKEDIVEPGKPNAAGWLLPTKHNIHRRYPEVAILIPNTVGRACAGLCVSCQRMYDFQSGHLNFDLEKLKPHVSWPDKLNKLLTYYENDSQLRDILITGGDALMSSDKSIKEILDGVYQMAAKKRENNKSKKNGDKYAEIIRVRFGTRMPAYAPQRITDELIEILSEFKEKASKIGLKQFVIQTHIESPMEITPEALVALKKLTASGWIVTNQLVFSVAASRRGHTSQLRKILNDCGVVTYYTFSVKGYMENSHNFATNARAMQEQLEEKSFGQIPVKYHENIHRLPEDAPNIMKNIDQIRNEANLPFLATDRNVINLPGVGKSQTFRTIGLTRDGRRILEFDHDINRRHSPIINKMGKIIIIESKSMYGYISQLESIGENPNEYLDVFGYSIGETEPTMPIFKYPEYDFEITNTMTNLDIGDL